MMLKPFSRSSKLGWHERDPHPTVDFPSPTMVFIRRGKDDVVPPILEGHVRLLRIENKFRASFVLFLLWRDERWKSCEFLEIGLEVRGWVPKDLLFALDRNLTFFAEFKDRVPDGGSRMRAVAIAPQDASDTNFADILGQFFTKEEISFWTDFVASTSDSNTSFPAMTCAVDTKFELTRLVVQTSPNTRFDTCRKSNQ